MAKLSWLLALYVGLLALLAVFSYGFADPNFILVAQPLYWQFQQRVWSLVVQQPVIATIGYGVWLVASWCLYLFIDRVLQHVPISRVRSTTRMLLITLTLVTLILLVSYNYLSHDVFNYLFNAKMVVVYSADPHIRTALEFATDPWVRFMHNTHTPAPYGYGWTVLSLVPFWFGRGMFSVTWVLFRAWSIVGWLLALSGLYWWGRSREQERIWLKVLVLTLSPLILTEVFLNAHNDGWMMAGAVWGLWLVGYSTRRRFLSVCLGLVLIGLSASIKLATGLLLPWVMILLLLSLLTQYQKLAQRYPMLMDWQRWLLNYTPLIASILLFMPLLTARSQWFNPWYLIWSLVWLPLVSARWWRSILLGFSVAATFRYLPWIWASGYTPAVLSQQLAITWIGGGVLSIIIWLSDRSKSHVDPQ